MRALLAGWKADTAGSPVTGTDQLPKSDFS